MSERSKRVHELITTLRNDGYDVAYGADENNDFPEHVAQACEALEPDELMGYYLVVMAPETTDYYSSSVVGGGTAMGVTQIQMLGAHFRSVLEATGLETTQLVDAMVDEAVTIGEVDDGAE
jgi:deoxyribodipyrimidine photolyase-like uncharacterized protein